ncbi:MAG: LacI family transcriptional regulator [Lachnospiraceae bacterium]|nr:LacI family transcriptional regulator [Lachnospiraceae bacterium]
MESKKPTIYDVAKEAGVSPASVSRMINHPSTISENLRKKIQDAMERLDFNIETSWHKNYVKSGIILLVYPVKAALLVENYVKILKASTIKDKRRLVMLAIPDNSVARTDFEEAVSTYQPIGIFAFFCRNFPFFEEMALSVPFIYVCDAPSETKYPSVDFDSDKIMADGVNHLKSRGCKNIVYFSPSKSFPGIERQISGIIDALRENNIYSSTNIITMTNSSQELSRETMINILSRKYMPDAVFCSNDYLALHLMNVASELGLHIPKDILVLSIGGSEISKYCVPSLTTFCYPHENISFIAYKMLNDLLGGNTLANRHIMISDIELAYRESTSIKLEDDTETELPTDYGETLHHVFSSLFRKK